MAPQAFFAAPGRSLSRSPPYFSPAGTSAAGRSWSGELSGLPALLYGSIRSPSGSPWRLDRRFFRWHPERRSQILNFAINGTESGVISDLPAGSQYKVRISTSQETPAGLYLDGYGSITNR